MKVVCNATPLIHLSAIGQFELLHELLGEVLIPEEVYQEVVIQGVGMPGAQEVGRADWIVRTEVSDRAGVEALATVLGLGEAACLILARSITADLTVMDDKLARLHGKAMGLRLTGTVGILLAGAERDKVKFEQALTELIATGFRLSPEDHKQIINLWRAQTSQ